MSFSVSLFLSRFLSNCATFSTIFFINYYFGVRSISDMLESIKGMFGSIIDMLRGI